MWAVRYNHFHDQLVLTSSSDARLVLTSVASISSEPDGHLGAPDDEVDNKNGRWVVSMMYCIYFVVAAMFLLMLGRSVSDLLMEF